MTDKQIFKKNKAYVWSICKELKTRDAGKIIAEMQRRGVVPSDADFDSGKNDKMVWMFKLYKLMPKRRKTKQEKAEEQRRRDALLNDPEIDKLRRCYEKIKQLEEIRGEG